MLVGRLLRALFGLFAVVSRYDLEGQRRRTRLLLRVGGGMILEADVFCFLVEKEGGLERCCSVGGKEFDEVYSPLRIRIRDPLTVIDQIGPCP